MGTTGTEKRVHGEVRSSGRERVAPLRGQGGKVILREMAVAERFCVACGWVRAEGVAGAVGCPNCGLAWDMRFWSAKRKGGRK